MKSGHRPRHTWNCFLYWNCRPPDPTAPGFMTFAESYKRRAGFKKRGTGPLYRPPHRPPRPRTLMPENLSERDTFLIGASPFLLPLDPGTYLSTYISTYLPFVSKALLLLPFPTQNFGVYLQGTLTSGICPLQIVRCFPKAKCQP
jgi:hypothetical protein